MENTPTEEKPNIPTRWSIEKIWNETLLQNEERKPYVRDYAYSSELGKMMIDRYYAMMGEPVTNPFEVRILRKFEAGHIFEWIVKQMLKKIGILKAEEVSVRLELPGLIPVSGRIDVLAGGFSNWDEARARLQEFEFPGQLMKIGLALINDFEKNYPTGLPEQLIEIKSVNSLVFWAHLDSIKVGYPHHRLQTYTYIKAQKREFGWFVRG